MGGGGGLFGLGSNSGYGGSTTTQGLQTDQGYLNEGAIQQNQAVAAEQGLAGQLQQVANGTGPNPAQAQFQQNANQINQQQAGAVASTKGINPALAAYMSNQQAGQNLQNAAGSAATLQAQQQIAAQGQIANVQNNIANQGLGAAQIGQSGFNASNQANASTQAANAGAANSGISGVIKGVGSLLSLAKGGAIPQMYADGTGNVAPGGALQPAQGITPSSSSAAPQSKIANMLLGGSSQGNQSQPQSNPEEQAGYTIGSAVSKGLQSLFGSSPDSNQTASANPMGTASSSSGATSQGALGASDLLATAPDLAMFAAKGGKVPAKVSPGEGYLNPQMLRQVLSSPNKGKAAIDKSEKIPGKAKVKGDSYANDTVDKTLQAGGLVLPRSVMNSKNPAKDAAAFVTAHLAKKGDRGMKKKQK